MIEIIQLVLLILIFGTMTAQFLGKVPGRNKGQAVILDSSALIDGRIMDVAKTGFAPEILVVPQFILRELQMLADGNDSHKRERARFGLDVVANLQQELGNRVVVDTTDFKTVRTADDKLVLLAQKLSGDLCTTDYNLNKVATIEGVRVLNLNELAQAVRPVALPGERQEIKIVQKGSNKDQGVGYLDDGTMVVVSGAGHLIGKRVAVSVTRMLQTEAGKMMFAKKITTSSSQAKEKRLS